MVSLSLLRERRLLAAMGRFSISSSSQILRSTESISSVRLNSSSLLGAHMSGSRLRPSCILAASGVAHWGRITQSYSQNM